MTNTLSPKESAVQTLRNSVKHINELYRQIDSANTSMTQARTSVEHLRKECGNLYVQVYVNGAYKQVTLNEYLGNIITTLTNGAIRA